MSIITDFRDRNDGRKDINPPPIQVAQLPPTSGLTPAPVPEEMQQPAVMPPAPAAIPPQVETPAEEVMPAAAPSSAPLEDVVVETGLPAPTQDEEIGNFIKDILSPEQGGSIQQPQHDRDAVNYDVVGNVQASDQDLQEANRRTQEQLMMSGQAMESAIEDAYNLGEFQPTLFNPSKLDSVNQAVARGNQQRAALGQNLLETQRQMQEEQFVPKPLPQTETDPRKPRPDTTAAFNKGWQGFLGNLQGGKFEPFSGNWGEAGQGFLGTLIYGLGLPQNFVYGVGLDIENAVQKSPLGGVYNQIGNAARGGLQTGLSVLGAGANFINKNVFGMGEVNTQLPKDFDPVRADPKFKGSYTINALRGEQYNFSDSASGSEMGIVTKGNNPSFMLGLGLDVISDPAGFFLGALAPLKKGNRVVRTAGRVGELVVDPIGEAVIPALGRVSSAANIFKPKALPPASTATPPAGTAKKPPKTGKKKKASQAGVANKTPNNINVTPNIPKAPPKGSPLREAWEMRQAARKARAEEMELVKRVIIPQPPAGTMRHPDKVTVVKPNGTPVTRTVAKPTSASLVLSQQAPKVQLSVVDTEVITGEFVEEIASRPNVRIPGSPDRPRLSPAKEVTDMELANSSLVALDDAGTVADGIEVRKVAEQTLRREEAELLRVSSRQAAAEVLAPTRTQIIRDTLRPRSVEELAETAKKTADDFANDAEWQQFNAEYNERLANKPKAPEKSQTSIGSQLRPQTVDEVQAASKKVADDYANDDEWKQFNAEYDAKVAARKAIAEAPMSQNPEYQAKKLAYKTAELEDYFTGRLKPLGSSTSDAVAKASERVAEARTVAESIPPQVTPSNIPTVDASVFQGEMTVSEVAEAIARNIPGTQVDGKAIKKSTRNLKQITALMKLVPHPASGKPLIAADRGDFKTYDSVKNFLLKEGIEDPTYFRLFEREGAAIPEGALDASAFRVVTNKAKPFNATPTVVVDNTPRVVAGQLEVSGELSGVKLDTSVKVSYDPSIIRPISEANKGKDFRGKLVKQRNALRRALDEVESPEEMEEILKRVSEIDDELTSPDLKQNPGHLTQLQEEVIPDTQHGTSHEVIRLTEQKLIIENEVADLSSHVRTLETELMQQQEVLDKALAQTLDTADIGRRELDVDYEPVIPANNVTDKFFETPGNVRKMPHSNNSMYFSSQDEEFFNQNASIVMRALDEVVVPGGVDVVYLTKSMINDMRVDDLVRLKDYIADSNNAAFMDWTSQKLFIRDALFDPDMDAGEAVRIIVHELGHKLHGRDGDKMQALRYKYRDAMLKDKKEVSAYAAKQEEPTTKIDEDFAEAVSFYRANPYKFSEEFPSRARAIAEELETAAAETLNTRVFYHGTRTPNWEQTSDPLTTQPRNVWGQGDYLFSDAGRAADDAQAELAINTPNITMKDVDMVGTVYEVKSNFQRVLRANDKVSPNTQRLFSDAMEDVLGRKTPETRKAIKHFNAVTSPKILEDGSTKYPRYSVKDLYGQMEKYAHKYLGTEGVTLPEETLSDLYRAVNLKMREAGYDAIFDDDLVVVLKPDVVTAINREVLQETDTLDVLVSRFNVDSAHAAANPTHPSAQVNMMESSVRLQKEMVENTARKLEDARTQQLARLQKYQEIDAELTDKALKEQADKRLLKRREGEAQQAATDKKLGKPNKNPCEF